MARNDTVELPSMMVIMGLKGDGFLGAMLLAASAAASNPVFLGTSWNSVAELKLGLV